jgi:hypothetical protein
LEHPDSPYLFDVFSDTYVPGEFFQQISGGKGPATMFMYRYLTYIVCIAAVHSY